MQSAEVDAREMLMYKTTSLVVTTRQLGRQAMYDPRLSTKFSSNDDRPVEGNEIFTNKHLKAI